MIFRQIYLISGLLFAQPLYADVKELQCQRAWSLEAARAKVVAVEAKYATVKSISGKFQQYAFLEALSASEQSEGELLFSKPGKMRWSYKKPEPQVFTSDGTTLWLHQPMDNQVIIDNFTNAFSGDIPVSFLLGLGSLTKDFTVEKGCDGVAGGIIDLAPAKSDDSLNKMRLLIDSKTNLPKGAEIVDVAGNKNTFILSGLILDQAIPASSFKPTFPKSTDIIDRRQK
jgi:outer membrane lipoprotein carrier protein